MWWERWVDFHTASRSTELRKNADIAAIAPSMLQTSMQTNNKEIRVQLVTGIKNAEILTGGSGSYAFTYAKFDVTA